MWMGRDMMRLSSDNLDHEMGIKFDPTMIVEGEKATGMAEKYFPGLVRWMREEENDEIWEEALVIVGNMEVVVPKSFGGEEREG